MKYSVGARLVKLTKAQSQGLRKSIDFLGVNYYTTYYAKNASPVSTNRTFYTDILATQDVYICKLILNIKIISCYKFFDILTKAKLIVIILIILKIL